MSGEKDNILLKIFGNGTDKPQLFLLSVHILRCFPLSLLNVYFPFGVPLGSFLTLEEVFSLSATMTMMTGDSHSTVCLNLDDSSSSGAFIGDSFTCGFFDSFDPLFEILENDSALAKTKALAIEGDVVLFSVLGLYFQNLLWRDRNVSVSSVLNFGLETSELERDGREFMFLKEETDFYFIPKSNKAMQKNNEMLNIPGNKDMEIISECLTVLTIAQHQKGVFWTKEFKLPAHPKYTSLVETLQVLKYLKVEGSFWSHSANVYQKRSLLAYKIFPLQQPENLFLDASDNVSTGNHIIKEAIDKKKFLQHCWWEDPLDVKTADNGIVGTLWLRRSWSLEFSCS